jgi:ATP-dependent Clp protease ATP-binding subunit ClpB
MESKTTFPQKLNTQQTGAAALQLEEQLRKRIVGQDEAITQIVNIYQMNLTGLNAPGRPLGSYLFLGPTGTGKTRTVEAASEILLGTARAVVKVDCAEFQHSHEIAKLLGSPPGYLGHRETHPLLSQEMLDQHFTERVKLSFVLFDEIEKASDALWNLLLGVLDKATLTLGDNRKVDFSRSMIFLTSNLGAAEMSSIWNASVGFRVPKPDAISGLRSAETDAKVERAGLEAARRKFTPEFMNRLDKIVVFRPLGSEELRRILDLELAMVQQRALKSSPGRVFVLRASDAAKDKLLLEGTEIRYGARHLKRALERLVVQPLANLIATDQVRGGDVLRIDCEEPGGEITFLKEAEGMTSPEMAEMMDLSLLPLIRAVGATGSTEGRSGRSGRRV